MLLRFRFSNVRSFRVEQEFSLISAPLKDRPDIPIQLPGMPETLLPVGGIYGPNASGKTNVLRALYYMFSAVENSHRVWGPADGVPQPHFRLSEDAKREPSRFAVDFILNGVRYEYGFAVDRQEVREEWLHAYPHGRKQKWFTRGEGPMSFSVKLAGENKAIEAFTRPNSLFLSAAAQNNHEALTPIYRWFSDRLLAITSERRSVSRWTAKLCEEETIRDAVSALVAQADLGLVGIRVEEGMRMPENVQSAMVALVAAVRGADVPASELDQELNLPGAIEFLHRSEGGMVPFPLTQESDGTVAFVSLLGPIVQALQTGSLLLVDELDAHLHPLLALRVIDLFNSKESNRRNAQLIFTTHDTSLLAALRRDQIWFTEKDRNGCSTLYPLTDFKPRRDENLQNGYLQGRYGAVPFINADRILASLGALDAKP